MVAADERAAVDLSLAEQGALMRAAAFEGAPSPAGPHQNDVRPVRGERERPGALEFADVGDTNERLGLHDSCSRCDRTRTWMRAGAGRRLAGLLAMAPAIRLRIIAAGP